MAKLRKRPNGVWQARWYVPIVLPDGSIGRERREHSTGQRDRALAREVARKLERDSVAVADGPPALTLQLALASYLSHLEALRRSKDTLDFYAKKGRHLIRIFGGTTDVHRLGPGDVTRYMHQRLTEGVRGKTEGGSETVAAGEPSARRITAHTVAKELGALRSALRWHAEQQRYHGRTDWCVPRDLRGAYQPRERALSREEFDALSKALDIDRRDYLALFVWLGPRDSELYRIEARDVDAAAARLHIRGTKTKRADRWVPLQADVLRILKRRAANTPRGPLFPRWLNVRRDLHAACKRAQIAPVSPNDLRRTFATWHAESGTSELVVAPLMGHSSSAMVRRVYARIGSAAQVDAAARFPALRKEPKRKKKKSTKKAAKKKPARKAKKR